MSLKLDLRKTLARFYRPPSDGVEVIDVPAMKYIMVDGSGDPSGEAFQQAVGTIYGIAYTMKFRAKRLLKKDYNVMALEGLWWMKEGGFDPARRDEWLWTLMIVQPDFVTRRMFTESVADLKSKKNPPGLARAHLDTFKEGLSAQTMHIGPYSAEKESISRLSSFAADHGYKIVGKHHEIYLGDPRRTAPSKLRTIIRHPLDRAGGRKQQG